MSDVRTQAFRRIRELATRAGDRVETPDEDVYAILEDVLEQIEAIASTYASSSESAEEKGRRLLIEGRLEVKSAHGPGLRGYIVAECRGDSGETYHLGYDPRRAEWRCTCEARGDRCSHLVALRLVTKRSSS